MIFMEVFGEYEDNKLVLNYQEADRDGIFARMKLNTMNPSVIKQIQFSNFKFAGSTGGRGLSISENFYCEKIYL